MKPLSILKSMLLVALISCCLSACGQNVIVNKTDDQQLSIDSANISDTSKTAFFPFNENNPYIFDETYSPATLTTDDIYLIESIFLDAVKDYNTSKSHALRIDLAKKEYKRQILVAMNKYGDKEVWINCLCSTKNKNWQKEIIRVRDGGNCYFNFKINLTKKKHYDFRVNGVA